MPRSRIIIDLANSSVDTATALKRAKVLLSGLNNEKLLDWVNCEITGYSNDKALPAYRIVTGNLVGSYFKGSIAAHTTWTNVSLPIGKMPDDIKEALLTVTLREGVGALKKLSECSDDDSGELGKIIPADFFPVIAKFNNDPYMVLTSARVIISPHCIHNIFSSIESRLLDVLMLLEKEFGNLDDLDIDVASKSQQELNTLIDKLTIIIFNDNSVSVGNNNKINESSIASTIL